MTNLHDNKKPNFVSFLRDNQPLPPLPHPDLEQKIIDSLESRDNQVEKNEHQNTWARSGAIARSTSAKLLATGFLFTSVSFSVKIPRIAVEPQELENFLVDNWQDTIHSHHDTMAKETEADWLFPTQSQSEPQPALSVSAP